MKTRQPDERDIARFMETGPLDLLDVELLADDIEDVGHFAAPGLASGGVNQVQQTVARSTRDLVVADSEAGLTMAKDYPWLSTQARAQSSPAS